MKKLSLSTALVSLLMIFNTKEVFAYSCKQEYKKGLVCNKKINNNRHPLFKIGGDLLSYGWATQKEGNIKLPLLNYSRGYGIALDGIFSITAEDQNDNLGISYGVNIEFETPYIKKSDFTASTSVNNRGTKLFINTAYGNFTFGYQKGVDSIMKIDAFSISAGDNSNSWMKYVNLRNEFIAGYNFSNTNIGNYMNNAFYLPTGLYTEGLFDGVNRFSHNYHKYRIYDTLINSLPLRLSYVSPNVFGMNFGISYSPLGYDDSSIIKANLNNENVFRRNKLFNAINKIKDSSIDQIISNAIHWEDMISTNFQLSNIIQEMENAYDYKYSESKYIDVSTILEVLRKLYARKKEFLEKNGDYTEDDITLQKLIVDIIDNIEYFNKDHRGIIIPVYDNIINLGLTYQFNVGDVNIKASITSEYAHFKNIPEKDIEFVKMNNIKNIAIGAIASYQTAKIAASYGYLGDIDSIIGQYTYDELLQKFLYTNDSIDLGYSYFWTIGASYDYENISVSASYHNSIYGGKNRLHDIGTGIEYNFSSNLSKFKYKIFANYHRFMTYQTLQDDHKKGSILLIGIKCQF
ncbi:porin [Neoehrlichia mikurensis]|uniref:Porin n=1 Tax=Neoehrlichia mikurensis TaxID=89586 RepID=A0A9Q9BS74_9RICK|nr:porin [Neoehrlichia mikurensis]QXK91889.1 porin [Neoehrlichia mikurensis]QXK93102.1 porin [Neoehrlichia mikurensis]QXK93582.1 porin [Neoehrlichia mikurensis]UTO55465.1 porin [Neoehrlichia mikurensis]UTO56385.1 porin [Neoehrlichia mikurensis]